MKGITTVYRTRQFRISKNNRLYGYCSDICRACAILYNRANFIIRQYSSAVEAMASYRPLYPNQICRIKDESLIRFPGTNDMLRLGEDFPCGKLKEVRIKPHGKDFVIDVVMDVETRGMAPADDKEILRSLVDMEDISGIRVMALDPGTDNIAAVVNNFGERPFVIKGA